LFSWFGFAAIVNAVVEPLPDNSLNEESPVPTICTNLAICNTSPLPIALANTTELH
jgi:hypothetical protein